MTIPHKVVRLWPFLSKIFLGTWGYSTVWQHKHELRPSSVPYARVVDVGANYGGVAVALAKHFESAQLVVLEPNPRLAGAPRATVGGTPRGGTM